MALYKRGRFWHYDFQFRGQRYKKSTKQTKKTLAVEAEGKRLRELREGAAIGTTIEDITFEELAAKYLKRHAGITKQKPKAEGRKKGAGFYLYTVRVLERYFEKTLLSRIGAGEVDEFMALRKREVSGKTANRSLAVLKHMFKLAVRWGYLAASPAADVKLEREGKGRERFLTQDEARALLAECPDWLRPLVVTALHTGARRGELLGLTWGDVDLPRGLVSFRETKNGEPRTIRMSETVKETLKALPRGVPQVPVFRNKGGAPMHPDGVTWSFRRAVRLAKLADPPPRFHDLRHTCASWLVQAGIPLNTVREILGHKSLAMTLRYAHLAPAHQAEATAVMDQALGTAVDACASPGPSGGLRRDR